VRKYPRAVREQCDTQFTDAPAHGTVFLPNGVCFITKRLEQLTRSANFPRRTIEEPIHCPGEIHPGRAGRSHSGRASVELSPKFVGRRLAHGAHRCHHAHRAADANRWRASNREGRDRLVHVLRRAQVALNQARWKQALIDDPHPNAVLSPAHSFDNVHGRILEISQLQRERSGRDDTSFLQEYSGYAALTSDSGLTLSSHEFLTVAVLDRIATLTLNRPDKLNALNKATIAEIGAAFDDLHARSDVGGIVVTGAGRAFAAGADIGELEGLSETNAREFAARGQAVFDRIEQGRLPVIAAVNGFALGGGCELAMACHIRIAGEAAKFGQPEVKLGLVPGYGGTGRLARLVGRGLALQILMTGDMIDAPEALRIGLVNRVVPNADLMPAAMSLMTKILVNGPLAIAECVALVCGHKQRDQDSEQRTREAESFGRLAATQDASEGVRGFLEKRTVTFNGR
jgi:enoyl-CoA hydratase